MSERIILNVGQSTIIKVSLISGTAFPAKHSNRKAYNRAGS